VNLADSPKYANVQRRLHKRLMDWMRDEGDYLLCNAHVMPVGSYIDGRSWEEQHDPGWSKEDWAWFRRRSPSEQERPYAKNYPR